MKGDSSPNLPLFLPFLILIVERIQAGSDISAFDKAAESSVAPG